MQEDLNALNVNNTWQTTILPLEKKTIGCKWVFKVKHKSDGPIDHHKARLVAKGYTQLEGLDLLDTLIATNHFKTFTCCCHLSKLNS